MATAALLALISLHALADELRSHADYFRRFDEARGERLERIADALDREEERQRPKEKTNMPGKRYRWTHGTNRVRIIPTTEALAEGLVLCETEDGFRLNLRMTELQAIPQKSTAANKTAARNETSPKKLRQRSHKPTAKKAARIPKEKKRHAGNRPAPKPRRRRVAAAKARARGAKSSRPHR